MPSMQSRQEILSLRIFFGRLQQEEQKHYDSLEQVLNGTVPACDCNDTAGKDYEPEAAYGMLDDSEDKKHDEFLATDCIGTEKLVSGEYNTDVFVFRGHCHQKASGRYTGRRAEPRRNAL